MSRAAAGAGAVENPDAYAIVPVETTEGGATGGAPIPGGSRRPKPVTPDQWAEELLAIGARVDAAAALVEAVTRDAAGEAAAAGGGAAATTTGASAASVDALSPHGGSLGPGESSDGAGASSGTVGVTGSDDAGASTVMAPAEGSAGAGTAAAADTDEAEPGIGGGSAATAGSKPASGDLLARYRAANDTLAKLSMELDAAELGGVEFLRDMRRGQLRRIDALESELIRVRESNAVLDWAEARVEEQVRAKEANKAGGVGAFRMMGEGGGEGAVVVGGYVDGSGGHGESKRSEPAGGEETKAGELTRADVSPGRSRTIPIVADDDEDRDRRAGASPDGGGDGGTAGVSDAAAAGSSSSTGGRGNSADGGDEGLRSLSEFLDTAESGLISLRSTVGSDGMLNGEAREQCDIFGDMVYDVSRQLDAMETRGVDVVGMRARVEGLQGEISALLSGAPSAAQAAAAAAAAEATMAANRSGPDDAVSRMSISELRKLLKDNEIPFDDVVERAELEDRARIIIPPE